MWSETPVISRTTSYCVGGWKYPASVLTYLTCTERYAIQTSQEWWLLWGVEIFLTPLMMSGRCQGCMVCNRCKSRIFRPAEGHLIKSTQPFERLNVDFKGPLPSTTQNKYMLVLVDEYRQFPFVCPCKDLSTQSASILLPFIFSIWHAFKFILIMGAVLKVKGIRATCTLRAYHPQGNGQVEKMNGTVESYYMALEDKGLPVEHWENVFPDAMHSIRSLISTATNETPNKWLFRHQRKSVSGTAVPSWMAEPGPVLMRRHVRSSKYKPLVDEVELVNANPYYAVVCTNEGRQMTVSTHDLAPISDFHSDVDLSPSDDGSSSNAEGSGVVPVVVSDNSSVPTEQSTWSGRVRKGPAKLDLWRSAVLLTMYTVHWL